MRNFKQFLQESKDQESLTIFAGRFQGFNIGHQRAINKLKSQYNRTVVFIIEAKKEDKEKNPFSGELRKEMIKTSCPGIDIFIIPNGFIPGAIKYLDLWKGSEKVIIASGEDREEGYKTQKTDKTPYEIEYIQTERPSGVSGTAIRKSLKENDFETYKKIAAKGLNNLEWFERLKGEFLK